MKYGDISVETARLICKDVESKCAHCPLRREGRKYLKFCNYQLRTLYEGEFKNEKEKQFNESELNILLEEEIQHTDEVERWLKEHDI